MTSSEEKERRTGQLTTEVFRQYVGLYERLPAPARQALIEGLDHLRVLSQGLFVGAKTHGTTLLDGDNGYSWSAAVRPEQYLQYTQGLSGILRGLDEDALSLLQRHEYLATSIAFGMLDRQFLAHHEFWFTLRYSGSDSHFHKESSTDPSQIEAFAGRPDRRRSARKMPFTMVGVGRRAIGAPVEMAEGLRRIGLRPATATEALAYAENLYPGERFGQWRYDRLELLAIGDVETVRDGNLRVLTLTHPQKQLGWSVNLQTLDSHMAYAIGGIGKNRFLLATAADQEVL